MKIAAGLLLFVLMGAIGVRAQAQGSGGGKAFAVVSSAAVKNAPFSADAISESTQVLADGNRIVRSSTGKLYRNSEGRFRREMANGAGGGFGTFINVEPSVMVTDPAAGHRIMMDPEARTARAVKVYTDEDVKINTEYRAAIIAREGAEKIRVEVDAARAAGVNPTIVTGTSIERAPLAGGFAYTTTMPSTNSNSKTENLGIQNFEGVDAEGTRTTTIIEAGAIGNERPIEVVYERWYSKDLQVVVYSKHTDPRFGEQTYRLTNINRSEPDPSLFAVPTEYRMLPTPRTIAPAHTRSVYERGTPGRVITPATKASKP